MTDKLIISTDELTTLITKQDILLVDVRDAASYAAGHITGAHHFDLSLMNSKQPPVVGLLPSAASLTTAMQTLGLKQGQKVVVYDDIGGPPSGRFCWTLKAFGHNNLAMLDGGVNAWQNSGHPLTDALPPKAQGDFQATLNEAIIANRENILQTLTDQSALVIDTRTAAEYSGEDIRSAKGGHIPGAVHLDWQESKDPDNAMRFKSNDDLLALLHARNISEQEQTIICYCQSHQRSALMCILLESLGFKHVKGYPGAWSDWGNQSDTPLET